MGDLGQRFEIDDITPGVADGFAEDGAGPVINMLGKGGGVVAVGQPYLDPLTGEGVGEQVVSAAVELADADDIVAGFTNGLDGGGNGRHAGGHGQCADSAFQSRHALFQHVVGRVHDAAINVTLHLEIKQI